MPKRTLTEPMTDEFVAELHYTGKPYELTDPGQIGLRVRVGNNKSQGKIWKARTYVNKVFHTIDIGDIDRITVEEARKRTRQWIKHVNKKRIYSNPPMKDPKPITDHAVIARPSGTVEKDEVWLFNVTATVYAVKHGSMEKKQLMVLLGQWIQELHKDNTFAALKLPIV